MASSHADLAVYPQRLPLADPVSPVAGSPTSVGNRDDLYSGCCFTEHEKIREPPEYGAPGSKMANRESIRFLLDPPDHLGEFLDKPFRCSLTSPLIPLDCCLSLSKRSRMNTGWFALQRLSRDCNRR